MSIDFKDETAPAESASKKAWMVTFTDLVSLMLTFFVMLFAMSSVKIDQWKTLVDALSTTLNPSFEKRDIKPSAHFNIATIFRKRAVNLDYLASVMKETVSRDPLLAKSQFLRLEDRLVIALPADLLFEPGSATMTERAEAGMFELGGVLRNIGNQIGVNGHTDPIPPSGGAFASNWELSIARAAAVTNALVRAGYPDDPIALGYADTRYRQLPAAMDEATRKAMGRRVDIVVFPTVGVK